MPGIEVYDEEEQTLAPEPPAEEPTQSAGNGAPAADKAEEAPVPAPPRMPYATDDAVPDWVVVPSNLRVPRGRQLVFLRFPPSITGDGTKGERQCICWSMSDAEEKIAHDRCAGNPARSAVEFPKQMIRVVDGVLVDWSKSRGPGSVDEFYREIGPKGRNLLARVYTTLHMTTEDELRDFFENCVAVRTAG